MKRWRIGWLSLQPMAWNREYYHQVVGINSRLDSFQAAALNVKMTHIDRWNRQRQKHARRYSELFTDAELHERVGLPLVMPGQNHVWNQYTIRVPDGERDAMRTYLAEAKIGSEIYYPVPLHLQECFETLGYSTGSLPETERAATEVLSLPVFPELTESQQQAVVKRISGYYTRRARGAA